MAKQLFSNNSLSAEMAASTRSQTAGGNSSSSSQAAASSRERKRKSLERSSSSARFCLFGVIHVETGARLFLLFYVLLSACGVAFGSVALMVWILVPLVVVPLAGYSLSRHASKYLYPFLVISVIHSLVALLMVLIVACFSLLCFDQLKAHFAAKSLLSSTSLLAFSPPTAFSSASFTALICALAMALSFGMALLFFWQSLVLFSCIGHFDLLAQQGRQQQQQIQQQMLKESKLQQSKNSAPADQRPMANGGGPTTVSRQLECSQCISEIRQLGQFSATTNERWNRPP